ncbi:MAG: EAL domain-containing protein [Solirubrobacteraceae bacterium]|jgi:diguanylate cyclase (GGDEF)-like protein/PAS domain S-box-containing protein
MCSLTDIDFELIADSIPQIVWTAGADGATDYFNQRGTEYTGLPQDTNNGWGWLALIHPDDAGRTERAWRDAVECEAPYAIEYRLRSKDGVYRWHECRAMPVRSRGGELVKWIGTVTDIEERRQLEASLRAAERRTAETLSLLETLQASAPVGFGFVDREFRQVRFNEALAATTGLTVEQNIGRTVAEVIPELWPELEPVYRRVLETGEAVVNRETSGAVGGDPGREHTWLTSFYPVRVEGEVIGIGIVVVDITERKASELKLTHMSEHDPLTGILNRRKLISELERILRYAARYDHTGAVLILDVDNFTWTNDSFGHAVGDHVLTSLAEVLRGRSRDTDLVARIGGDEFAVVLPEADEEEAVKLGLEVRALLCGRPLGPPVRVSIGIALFNGHDTRTADDVLVAADIAMYQAKDAGGDQAAIYKGPFGDVTRRVRAIQEALARRRFVLHAQPIVDLRSNHIAFRELLIRMRSDSGEDIAPGEFLPVAERFSLIAEIDRWVINEAIQVARDQPVTVNLSARSIGDPRILTAVRASIAAGLDPPNLTFEITETAAMTDFGGALGFVSALGELGCHLALDDFGTGFGSFTYLKHLPARYLKIDMEFVRDINTDPSDKEIVRSIVGIAHTLGKEAIAEGVESPDVLQTLRELGVDYAQGFYIGRPEPLAAPDPSRIPRVPRRSASLGSSTSVANPTAKGTQIRHGQRASRS